MKRGFVCFCLSALALGASAEFALDPEGVRVMAERARKWQLDNRNLDSIGIQDWRQAAFYTGLMESEAVLPSRDGLAAMRQTGETAGWNPGTLYYNADDQAVGNMYLRMALRFGEPAMSAPMLERLNYVLANPSTQPVTTRYTLNGKTAMRWWWVDAAYMAAPVWSLAYRVTGAVTNRDFMVAEFQAMDAVLYNTEYSLYARDSTYIGTTGDDGYPIFWSRGNGWAIAALAQVLGILPEDDGARSWFEGRLSAMAARLAACQHPDGFWGSDIMNASSTNAADEASGTALICYAIAYGVNRGILDDAAFVPVVSNAWQALCGALTEDGRLTHVQPSGAGPAVFGDTSSALYGTGGFLLAGSEVYRMALRLKARSACESAASTVSAPGTQPVTLPLSGLPEGFAAPYAVWHEPSGAWVDAAAVDTDGDGIADALHFTDRFLPGETRTYRVFSETTPPVASTLNEGLVARWKMDEANAGAFYDLTGKYDAYPSGTVAVAEGKVGNALNLTGGYNSTSSLFAPPFDDGMKMFTVAGWINPNASYSGQFPRILGTDRFALLLRDDNNHYRGVLDLAMYNTKGGIYLEWSHQNSDNASKIQVGEWTHVAVVFDMRTTGTPPRFYVNGVLKDGCYRIQNNTGTTTLLASYGSATVIGNRSGRDRSFNGKVDDLCVYDRPLTTTEVVALYHAGQEGSPTVDAGAGGTVCGLSGTLSAALSDSGLAKPGATVLTRWTLTDAPEGATAAIDDPEKLATAFTATAAGNYTFTITADNGSSQTSSSVTFTMAPATANAANVAPAVSLPLAAYEVALPAGLRLVATATDADGIPGGICTVRWAKTSGDGDVAFSPAAGAETVATFSRAGTYTITATASDGLAESTTAATVTVRDGTRLLRWFRFNEPMYRIAADSARGADGIIYGAGNGSGVAGKEGNGTSYIITEARVEFPLPPLSTMTVAAWVKIGSQNITWPRIFSLGNREINFQADFSSGGVSECLGLNCRKASGADEWRTPTKSLPSNEWTHVALVLSRDATAITPAIYINGAEQTLTKIGSAAATAAVVPSSTLGYIGNSYDLSRQFPGTIDDFRIYDSALGAEEIAAVMNDDPASAEYWVCETAGGAPRITMPELPAVGFNRAIALEPEVAADGSAPTYSWTVLSGPGKVSFLYANDKDTTAVFHRTGTYTIALTVTDGLKKARKTMSVIAKDYTGSSIILR
jgi:unsaturated rhamnogalacturonyl hydrolase